MSSNCQIFFNLMNDSNISEFSTQDIDLHFSHNYEDDRDLIFSRYKCELSAYKLNDRYAERVSSNFLNAYSDIYKSIDWNIEPMFVFDMQRKIGYLNQEGKLNVMWKIEEKEYPETLNLILKGLS